MMLGHGSLSIVDYKVLFTGTGSMTVGKNISLGSVRMTGKGYLLAVSSVAYVNGNLPALEGAAYETDNSGYGYCDAMLPGLTTHAEGGTYIPAELQYVFGILAPLTSYAQGTAVGIGEVDVDLPGLHGKAWESLDGGECFGDLPALQSAGYADFSPGEVPYFEKIYLSSGYGIKNNHVVFFNSAGQIIGTYSTSSQNVANFLNLLTASDSFTVVGNFAVPFFSTMHAGSQIVPSIGSGPALDNTARVWVVNMRNNASGQYDHYGFNSFFERDGEYFGVADDGIYKLDGDDDAGVEIDALLELGLTNYDTYKIKKALAAYIGCSSSGDLFLKVVADGVEEVYQMTGHSTAVTTHVVPIAHDLLGTQWNLTLVNADGCDFDVADIDFRIFPTTRRVF